MLRHTNDERQSAYRQLLRAQFAKADVLERKVMSKSSQTPIKNKSFCAWEGDVLVLNILGAPSSKKDAIGKPKGNQLKVSVTATPVAGKATDHMVKFLAKEFEVSPKDIVVVFGRFNVNKQLRITAPKRLPAVISKELAT